MEMEEYDDLDSLLGRAKTVEPSPFFARNVLRHLRQQQAGRKRHRISWRLAWLTSAMLVLALLGTFTHQTANMPDQALFAGPSDIEIIQDLDELLVSQEDTTWTDDTSI